MQFEASELQTDFENVPRMTTPCRPRDPVGQTYPMHSVHLRLKDTLAFYYGRQFRNTNYESIFNNCREWPQIIDIAILEVEQYLKHSIHLLMGKIRDSTDYQMYWRSATASY